MTPKEALKFNGGNERFKNIKKKNGRHRHQIK